RRDPQRTKRRNLFQPSRKLDLFLNTQARVEQSCCSASRDKPPRGRRSPLLCSRASGAPLPPRPAAAANRYEAVAEISRYRQGGGRNCARSRIFRCAASANPPARCRGDTTRAVAFRRAKSVWV